MALVEPAPPDPSWPRYSGQAFPPYRFVPGLNPHPRRHPKGHAYGTPETPPPYVPPERWRENPHYLYGVDLYNHAYWWECHEALEALWHLTGHKGEEAAFLQGVIQAAAAHLKRHMGSPDGARRLGREAAARLATVPGPRYMGLDLPPFIRGIEARHVAETSDAIPLISLQ
ncbi:MAG TPA: DUF309 domain-containing protein [Planctomycetota bacterium]